MSKWMMAAFICMLVVVTGCEKKESTTGDTKSGLEATAKGATKAATDKSADKPAATGSATAQAEAVLIDITSSLEGVTSKETAEAAKAKLAPLATKLDEAMASVKKMMNSTGTASLTGMGQGLAEGMKGALSGSLKGAVDKVMAEIKRITGNAELLAPLKGVLEKIQAAVKI